MSFVAGWAQMLVYIVTVAVSALFVPHYLSIFWEPHIVLGSSAPWRRQSRFYSPTVDFVLRNAPCEVLVVAFPDGIFEE